VTVDSIEVLRAKQRKRERGFQDFWNGIEGKRSFSATAEFVTAKLSGIKEHPQ
jgi:hypothetical protein